MDAEGHAFFQNAYARTITHIGAHLSGIEHGLNTGDVIGVQLGDTKARCRVLQAVDAGLPHKIKADIELLEGQPCPWKEELGKKPVAAAKDDSSNPANKRRFPRHKMAFSIELRDDRGTGVPMQTSASDISGRGCYVETLVPLPLGTPIHIAFWIDERKNTTSAIVRASDPGVGMGIEFIGLALDAQQKLQEYLDKIDPLASGFAGSRSNL